MASKKKRVKLEEDAEEEDEEKDSGPDYTAQLARVLVHLKAKSPIVKNDLSLILGEVSEDFDFVKLWELLKRSVYARHEVSTDQLFFEHALQNVKTSNLKEFIDRKRSGVSREELVEFNPELAAPIQELLKNGSVLPLVGWRDSNRTCLMMYPRGNSDFRVPLSGKVSVTSNSMFLDTTEDLRKEVRRGDAIILDGKTYRISSETSRIDALSIRELRDFIANELGGDCGDIEERDVLQSKAYALLNERGVAPKKFSKRAGADGGDSLEKLNQFSCSSVAETVESLKGPVTYKYEFDSKRLPLDRPYIGAAITDMVVYKFGCTNDVREAYWKVAENSSSNFKVSESERLDSKLREKKLITEVLL